MSTPTENEKRARQRQGSFTLIETVIALSLITFLIIEVATVQGNSIVFSEYSRNVTKATWLAKRVMSQVEYQWHDKPFKDLETSTIDAKFEDEPDFTYNIEIKEWKFPFKEMLGTVLGGGSIGGDEGDKQEDAGISKMIDTVVSQIFGDEPIFMTAYVQVFWAEGAQKNESSLTYLLTNQKKMDDSMLVLKPQWDALTKPPTTKKKPTTPNGTTAPNKGTQKPNGTGQETNPSADENK